MKTYHLKKVKDGKGWEVTPAKAKDQICWGATKATCLRQFRTMLNDIQPPISLRIHNAKGKFAEERTYPRSADPKKSKG